MKKILLFSLLTGSTALATEGIQPGIYGMEMSIRTATQVPFFGETIVETRSVLRVEVVSDAQGLRQRQKVCAVNVHSNAKAATTTIPQSFISALPSKEYEIYQQAINGRWRFSADPGPDAVGFDPALAQIPSGARDPGVLDPDGDGHPGATVNLKVPVFGRVDVYVIQRGHSLLDGEVTADGRVSGQVEVLLLEQRTLGASNPLFVANPPVRVLEDNPFTMVPVPDWSTCEDISEAMRRAG